jgi:hypothetical protein
MKRVFLLLACPRKKIHAKREVPFRAEIKLIWKANDGLKAFFWFAVISYRLTYLARLQLE